jgi:Protein of unknown function (DUF669)
MSTLKWSEWLASADEQGFSTIPAGEYDLYVDSVTAKQSSSGKDMLATRFKVEAGPHEGASVFTNFVISPESPAALSFLIRKLAALGLDREYLSKNPSLEKIAQDLEHRRCTGKVSVREFNGSERNDIDTLKPPADGKAHRPSGPVPDTAMGVFGMPSPVPGAHHVPAHHAGKAPELPF